MGTIEIDLHGLTWKEARQSFEEAYGDVFDSSGNPTGDKLQVIHGYGSTGEGGVLRKRLRSLCQSLENYLEVTEGEAIDGNMGCTIITPMKCLPAAEEMLAEGVWEFCIRSRERSKIMRKFRRHGDPLVLRAIKVP